VDLTTLPGIFGWSCFVVLSFAIMAGTMALAIRRPLFIIALVVEMIAFCTTYLYMILH
jgi:hypothetical protein